MLLPSCMMRQLFLVDGDLVRIRAVTLPLCGCVYLQPRSQEFYEIAGAEPELVLQESLAQLPALTSGLSVQVEVGIAQDFKIGLRRVAVVVARLEDTSGNEVVAAKLPGHAGVLGDHEIQVELLPAADLAESGNEYQERLDAEAKRQAKIQQMLESKHSQLQTQTNMEASNKETDTNLGSSFEMCFRLPNGKQMRQRCPTDETVLDLKKRLFCLLASEASLWKPGVERASALDFTIFPRKVLGNQDTVLEIGDRAVVHVSESEAASQEAKRNKELLGSVLYPAELQADIATSEQSDLPPQQDDPHLDFNSTSPQTLHTSVLQSEGGLEALPLPELRTLALSLGLPAQDIARAVDQAELLALVTQHQRRVARIARARETSATASRTERRASSLSARRGASEPARAPVRSSQSVGAGERRSVEPSRVALPPEQSQAPNGYAARSARPPRGNGPDRRSVLGPATAQRSTTSSPNLPESQRSLPPLPSPPPARILAEGRRPPLGASPTHPRLGMRQPLRHAGHMMLQDDRSRAVEITRSASPCPKRRVRHPLSERT